MIPTLALGQFGQSSAHAGGGGGGATSTWSASDKNAGIVLSNGNLTATHSGTNNSWEGVRTTLAKTTGKWYCEIVATSVGSDTMFGIDSGAGSLSSYPGNAAAGYGYYSLNGNSYSGASGSGFGAGWTSGDVIGIAYDADAGKVWFAKNNTWQASGNPGAGTNPAYSGVSAGQYPMAGGFQSSKIYDLHVTAAAFTYSAPGGFSQWG